MKITSLICLLAACGIIMTTRAADPLAAGFTNPPEQTKPWCYWYWVSDNISKEGITKDLEAMQRAGIGEALIGNIYLNEVPGGKIKVFSDEWWQLMAHAIREGGRLGVNIGVFNCPGWSQSGGPWIKPGEAMRYVTSSELRLTGPQSFSGKLAVPAENFQDIAVLAFPAPADDADALAKHSPRITCTPSAADAEKLVDGNRDTTAEIPLGNDKTFTVNLELTAPLTARSLEIVPGTEPFGAECELLAADAAGNFSSVRKFTCDRSNMGVNVGPMPRGPVAVSFAPVTATKFRLVFTGWFGRGQTAQLAEINLSGAARLEDFVEKQLGKMHATPQPMWDAYLWPTPPEPDSAQLVIPAGQVQNISSHLAPDGTLTWSVPPGDWVVLRAGMTPTTVSNSPASPEGKGLEVDKMNRKLAQYHFDSFIGELLKRIPAADRKAFKQVVADSYETGPENWTDGFGKEFQQRYGYDPKPWLPVLTGRIVGSADQSERFLWDLRRLVADRVATDYVGGLSAAANAHGLGLWLENYGHWGFPSEFLKYGGASDRIGGEFWVTGDLGSIECRAASSSANTYGKPFVSAESFTGGPPFQSAPGALKARGDWSFCEGVNHVVLHVYIEQPDDAKVPGVNAPFGTEFNRHNTWFEQGRAWIDYERRCCWLLQQGWRVADVAYFIGEDAPKMTGVRDPELPPGRDFDYINADVIEHSLAVKNGVLTLPHGVTYRVLVLPKESTMRPELLRKIRDLVKAGATVVGPPPSRSPSLQDFPQCDEQVKKLAMEIWGAEKLSATGERKFGRGRVIWGEPLDQVLASLGSSPDFVSATPLRFTHRRSGDTDIYFVANPGAAALTVNAAFRAGDRAPELWWPDSGRIEHPAVYAASNGVVRLPLSFGPHGSVFVVFREAAAPSAQRVVAVTRDGRELLNTKPVAPASAVTADSPDNFSFAVWVKPGDDTTLMPEANRGIVGMSAARNDVFFPPHGDGFGGTAHAGCGLTVGRNGVCVFEHGANYFAPTLVCPATLTNWTLVTVVYRDDRPSLYLNGVPAHTGLKSEHIVHSGAGSGVSAQFRGRAGEMTQFTHALSDAEVQALTKTLPVPPDYAVMPPVFTLDARGQITAQVAQAGDYQFQLADGSTRELNVPSVPPARELNGAWEVSFTPGWGAPEQVTFDQLTDWTRRPEDGIRHYSGHATYRKTFELPASALANPVSRLILDLGEAHDLATVRVNGKNFTPLWLAPWRVDITGALQPGENQLEIEVVNVWNNRLAGDAALPPEQRRTTLLVETVAKDAPLMPAGLIGPVTLLTTTTAEIK